MSIAPIAIVFGLVPLGILRQGACQGGDMVIFSDSASWPRAKVLWLMGSGEALPATMRARISA